MSSRLALQSGWVPRLPDALDPTTIHCRSQHVYLLGANTYRGFKMADIIPNVVVSMPNQLFTMPNRFAPVFNGMIYIGKIDTDPTIPANQIQVYLENEDGSLVQVPQPIRTNSGGYPVYNGKISKFVTVQGQSMLIKDANGVQLFYYPNVLKYDPDQFEQRLMAMLQGPYGAGNISNVFNHYETTSEIKGIEVPALTKAIHTVRYQTSSTSMNDNVLIRDPSEDNVSKSGTDWKTNLVINGKALIFDNKGKAFRLFPVNGFVTIEGLGGGEGGDDAPLMEIAQQVSSHPVRVIGGKTYFFGRPVKHSGCKGWIGRSTIFKSSATAGRFPFISSTVTATGVPNDTVNGTTGVSGAVFEGISIDTNYTDLTGAVGYSFAENTLDNWVDCVFRGVAFTNSKFDNIALQNTCLRVSFERCSFINSGEDAVTIRKKCEQTSFIRCRVINTAQVSKSGGVKFGDGIVVKGKFTLIDGCYFENVGNHIKGAGIANNAEDTDDVFQASYGTYVNNRFVSCYGGVGVGTVNPDFIAAGLLIEGITLDNNTYINTDANAVGFRYVRDLNHGKCKIEGQNLGNYHAVELINVVNINGEFDVRTAKGGACTVTNCNGKIDVNGVDVSKTQTLNSLVVSTCDGLNIDAKITTSNRNGFSISSFSNGEINFIGKGIALQGIVIDSISRSRLSATVTQCGNNGTTITAANDCNLDFMIFDAGTVTNDTYSSVRFIAGSRNRFRLISSSGQANKPKYDFLAESGVSGSSAYLIMSAGVTAKKQIAAGATITIVEEVV